MSDAPLKLWAFPTPDCDGYHVAHSNSEGDVGDVPYLRARPGDLPDRMAAWIERAINEIDSLDRLRGIVSDGAREKTHAIKQSGGALLAEYDALKEKGDG